MNFVLYIVFDGFMFSNNLGEILCFAFIHSNNGFRGKYYADERISFVSKIVIFKVFKGFGCKPW